RKPVYRMADPNGGGGFRNADWVVPVYGEGNSAEYVVGEDARQKLLAKGFRDDGVVFYVPDDATRPVYRKEYVKLWNGDHVTLYFTDGPEADAHAKDDPANTRDFGVRFKVYDSEKEGTVALHRVLYSYHNSF